ncbi:MAG: spore germination protein [Oscillospiraceae bacterium]|nr:spore germination protein [Oscillospiraceae bacterium]
MKIFKDIFNKSYEKSYTSLKETSGTADQKRISSVLSENIFYVRTRCGDATDIIIREVDISGQKGAFLMCDGMCDGLKINNSVAMPILARSSELPDDPVEKYNAIRDMYVGEIELKEYLDMDEALLFVMSGFLVFLLDGVDRAMSFGMQGFKSRGVEDSVTDVQARGAREAFVESFKVNITLIRRRLRTTDLRFSTHVVGQTSKTNVILCYLADRVDSDLLDEVTNRITNIELDTVMSSGYIQPFLDTDIPLPFSGVGVTERPDVFCSKISEGRIGIIVDGTPYSLYVPHFFTENFHSLDDYDNRPYYATFIRTVKWAAFAFSILLPGFYVSMGVFHQELFPENMLYDILSAELKTPFPLIAEALLIHFIFELMREAGMRMPKTVGHAVSIVGALVIGDAAVSAGLVAAPMLIVVALTAISSFVVPPLYEPVAVLRLSFIIIGGTLGLYGITLGLGLLIASICAIDPYGIVYTAPISPFSLSAMRDTIVRIGWKRLGKQNLKADELGSKDRG